MRNFAEEAAKMVQARKAKAAQAAMPARSPSSSFLVAPLDMLLSPNGAAAALKRNLPAAPLDEGQQSVAAQPKSPEKDEEAKAAAAEDKYKTPPQSPRKLNPDSWGSGSSGSGKPKLCAKRARASIDRQARRIIHEFHSLKRENPKKNNKSGPAT